MNDYKDFGFKSAAPPHTMRYLLPAVLSLAGGVGAGTRLLDVGCGNGYVIGEFLKLGCDCVGVDLSEQGIEIARDRYPNARFELMAADSSILDNLGEAPFDLVVSTEVVEHLYAPKLYAKGCFSALRPGGRMICSTPYHGYMKNVLIAAAGKFDWHHGALWDGGHIKFWSRATLGELLKSAGFDNIQFRGAGRLPYLWMSMVMSGDRPLQLK